MNNKTKENLKVIGIGLFFLIAFGIVGEMDYQDQIAMSEVYNGK